MGYHVWQRKLVGKTVAWHEATRYKMPEFLSRYTLHMSSFNALVVEQDWVTAILAWATSYSDRNVPEKQYEFMPYLAIRFHQVLDFSWYSANIILQSTCNISDAKSRLCDAEEAAQAISESGIEGTKKQEEFAKKLHSSGLYMTEFFPSRAGDVGSLKLVHAGAVEVVFMSYYGKRLDLQELG